ncbi:MAG: VCBS repeat-containing protein [Deltaproteobacteria bacterium]|nr:MAG: VCBS repeat-containing protein [Deltaproteobacteria bacterium]
MRILPALTALALFAGCGEPADKTESTTPEPAAAPSAPGPGLLMVQAWFKTVGGKPKPQPAKLVLLKPDAQDKWHSEEILDGDSNVFHKAIWWRDGILTIGAMKAQLKHWKRVNGEWKPELLWEQSWGGQFDRLRDIEFGDVDGDGADEMVIATHDVGVVAVGDEVDGKWTFTEFGSKPDTFVHEIEIGDVDGDGKVEAYATPSARNRASMESQPGGVAKIVRAEDGTYSLEEVVHWDESHAKEILVTDLDGDGTAALYAVREAHTEKTDAGVSIVDPVKVVQLVPGESGWEQKVVAELQDQQCRFLLPVDVEGDGKKELVAAGFKNGLYLLRAKEDGTFDVSTIDANSSGFEHATHAADLDGDGKAELYVASDNEKELRRYVFNGSSWDKTVLAAIPTRHITWNIQDGVF